MTEIIKGKNCFITGATSGLGKEITKQLINSGCNTFLTSFDDNDDFIKSIQRNDSKIFYEKADLTDKMNFEKIIKKCREEFGKIDILINCAGIFPIKSIKDSSIEDFEKCFDINVKVPFKLIKEFSEDMKETKWGRIVNIASSSAYMGVKDSSIYCSSKHALLGLSRSIFNELKEHNIRTYSVSPGSMKTEMGKMSGEISNQNYDTFIDPTEVAKFLIQICSYDNEMISEEIRLNRMKIE